MWCDFADLPNHFFELLQFKKKAVCSGLEYRADSPFNISQALDDLLLPVLEINLTAAIVVMPP